jgi:hypothetical protein
MVFKTVQQKEKEPLRSPPHETFEHRLSYLFIGQPSPDIDIKSVPAWVAHFKTIWRTLRTVRDSLREQEERLDRTRWRTENEIAGLKRTVEWQAKVLGESSPHLRIAVNSVRKMVRYIPEFIPDVVRKDMKADGIKGQMPFFTEAFLYPLMGKEEARSVLASMRQVCESVGLDMEQELNKAIRAKDPNGFEESDDDD